MDTFYILDDQWNSNFLGVDVNGRTSGFVDVSCRHPQCGVIARLGRCHSQCDCTEKRLGTVRADATTIAGRLAILRWTKIKEPWWKKTGLQPVSKPVVVMW